MVFSAAVRLFPVYVRLSKPGALATAAGARAPLDNKTESIAHLPSSKSAKVARPFRGASHSALALIGSRASRDSGDRETSRDEKQ